MIIFDTGEELLFRQLLERLWLTVRLYTNPHVPDRSKDIIDDYIELTGHGYGAIQLGPDDWRLERDRRQRLYAEARAAVWVFEAGYVQRVYGYYATEQGTQRLVCAGRLDQDGPILLQNQGERLRVILRFRSPVVPRISRRQKEN